MIRISPQLVMLISFAGISVLNYAFGIAIGWLLVPEDYGLVGFAQTILLICSLILNSGFAWSLTAQIAATPNQQERHALVRGSIAANIALSLILVLGIGLLFQGGLLRTGLETWVMTAVVVSAFPFLSLIAIVSGTLRGAEAFTSLAAVLLLEVVFKAGSGILLTLAGYGAVGAQLGFTIGGLIAAAIGLWRVKQVLNMPVRGPVHYPSLKMTGDMFGALIGMALLLNLDIIVLKIFSNENRALAGFYQSAIMLANMPYYMATAIFNVMFQQLAQRKDIRQSVSLVANNLKIILVFFIPIEIGLMIAPEQVLSLIFPPAYQVAAPILRLLAAGNTMLIFTALLATTFQATYRANLAAKIFALVIPLEILGLVAFVPSHSMVGASAVFGLACTFACLIQLIVYLRLTKPHRVFESIKWLTRYSVCLLIAVAAYGLSMAVTHLFVLSVSFAGLLYVCAVYGLGVQDLPMPLQTALIRVRVRGS